MADILWSDVTGMFPADAALAAVSVSAQTIILEHVNKSLSANYFGGPAAPMFKLARILYAAHFATASGFAGNVAAGPVIKQSEGGVDVEYAVINHSMLGAHSATSYGRQFDDLVRSSPMRIGVTS